jgi:hypothetical protein
MPNWTDRLFLMRSGIAETFEIRSGLTVFKTKNDDAPWVLKFSYPGNIQYHKISRSDADRLTGILNSSRKEEGEK